MLEWESCINHLNSNDYYHCTWQQQIVAPTHDLITGYLQERMNEAGRKLFDSGFSRFEL